MDICFTANEQFSLRAAALIIDHDCLLAVRHAPSGSIYTIGGRVHMGESTADAAMREAFEETGRHFAIDRLLFINEGFYIHAGKRHHEVCFFYLMQPCGEAICSGAATDQTDEQLIWLPIDRLPETPLVPTFLRTALRQLPQQPVHLISRQQEN